MSTLSRMADISKRGHELMKKQSVAGGAQVRGFVQSYITEHRAAAITGVDTLTQATMTLPCEPLSRLLRCNYSGTVSVLTI